MGGIGSLLGGIGGTLLGGPLGGVIGGGLGTLLGGSGGGSGGGTQTIDPTQLYSGVLGAIPNFTSSNYNLASTYNPQYTQLNLGNMSTALRGTFDVGAFDNANPGFLQKFRDLQSQGQLKGWTPEQYAYAYAGKNYNDPSLGQYYTGGSVQLARDSYAAANPELTQYTRGLSGMMSDINSRAPGALTPAGYTAATTAPVAATGGPLLNRLQASAGRSLDRISPIQSSLQNQARALVNTNGGLTSGELANVQDSVRSAYADRGLLRSNAGIGAEILQTDQARRQRMLENAQFAQGVDATGQQQLQANRNYALGVQGQGQGLSQFNAGLLSSTGMFNANQVNQAGQYNANSQNLIGQFNANMQEQAANDAWQRAMQYGGFQLGQAQNPIGLAAGVMGTTPDYTGTLLGVGTDVAGYNANALNAANIARGNNNAAMWGSGLSALGSFLGSSGGSSLLSSGLSSLGGLCWVAREVYGASDPRWRRFREWIIMHASPKVLVRYAARGPELAAELRRDPSRKPALRDIMDRVLASFEPQLA